MTNETLKLKEKSLKELETLIKKRVSIEFSNLMILKNMLGAYKKLLEIMELEGIKKDTELNKTEALLKKVTERMEVIEEDKKIWGGDNDN